MPVVDEVELPSQAKASNGNGPQLFRIEFSLDGEPREKGDTKAAFHGILDAGVAAKFEGDIQITERGPRPHQAFLQRTARAGARLANDERFSGQGAYRDRSSSRPRMSQRDDEDERIAA